MSKIKFNIPASISSRLIVYDILGKEITTLIEGKLKPGEYEIDFDTQSLPPGTYFCKLVTDGFIETKKVILSK